MPTDPLGAIGPTPDESLASPLEGGGERGGAVQDGGPGIGCPHCGGYAEGARVLGDGALVCPICSCSFMPGEAAAYRGPTPRPEGAAGAGVRDSGGEELGATASDTPSCPHCGGYAEGARVLGDGALVCPSCSRSFMPGQAVGSKGPSRRAPSAQRGSTHPAPESDPDALFSDGFFGLLEKGPLGWVLFGLIGGFLWAAFQWLWSL